VVDQGTGDGSGAAKFLPQNDQAPSNVITADIGGKIESHFDPNQPRGADGKWIEVGGLVKIIGGIHNGKRGEVLGYDDRGVVVQTGPGTRLKLKAKYIEQAPEKARLDIASQVGETPEPWKKPEAPQAPEPPKVTKPLTGAEAADHLFARVPKDITPEDKRAISDYAGSDFGPTNEWLRSGQRGYTDPHIKGITDALDRNMTPLDAPIDVDRYVDSDVMGLSDNPQDLIGKTIVDDGFVSTTVDGEKLKSSYGANFFGDTHIRVHVKPGHRALYVGRPGDGGQSYNALSPSDVEQELILARGSGIRITSASYDTWGNLNIEADAVDSASVAVPAGV